MGTNFYLRAADDASDLTHIGKRSAAGPWCWDCSATLCKDGVEAIHKGRSEWYSCCPLCGGEREAASIAVGAVGRELGFNKAPYVKAGVGSCSSWTWAMRPEVFCRLAEDRIVESEYGDAMTVAKFREDVLDGDCPVRFYEAIGSEFS